MAAETPLSQRLPALRRRTPAQVARRDRIAYLLIAGTALVATIVVVLIAIFVFQKAWPAFSHNGLTIVSTSGTSTETDLSRAFAGHQGHAWTTLHLLSPIYGTFLTSFLAVAFALPFSIFASIFIAEFAPAPLRAVLEPVVRLLAGIPSVIYGLVALYALGPVINDHLVSRSVDRKLSLVIPGGIGGRGLLLGVIVLFVMIAPIMIAINVDALRAVPETWREASYGLGVNQWRTIVKIFLRVIRPAIVAGTILALGRAVGEAIALYMVAGGVGWSPNPLDGFWALLEPTRPLASTIFAFSEGLGQPDLIAALFACAAIIFVTALALSLAARIALLPFREETARA
jgi:phosphate transport system permease protein